MRIDEQHTHLLHVKQEADPVKVERGVKSSRAVMSSVLYQSIKARRRQDLAKRASLAAQIAKIDEIVDACDKALESCDPWEEGA
jgi:hypothetical protein